jgi:hypothetical protein
MTRLNRRAFLDGAGVALALPFLPSLRRRRLAAQPVADKKRLLVIYTPNGMNMADWTPSDTGADYALTPILAPLAPIKSKVLVLSGIDNRPAMTDTFGQHAPATAAFLTCRAVKKSQEIANGVSMDQVAAATLGAETRFASLQLGTDGGSSAGGCDGGYSCAYTRNISWAGRGQPIPKMVSPRAVFDLLFAGYDPQATAEERARRLTYDRSVIDAVLADAARLEGKLGASDRAKLDQYLTGVRELELRLGATSPACVAADRPPEGPSFPARVQLMLDLMALAVQCDLTRVVTFMMGNSISGQSFPWLDVPDAHHALSHHQKDPAKLAKLTKIDRWEVEQMVYLAQKLDALDDGDGATVLDNSLLYFASEVADGNSHQKSNLPILLAGRAGSDIRSGRHVHYSGAHLGDLFISMLYHLGVSVDTFGDDGTGFIGKLA